MEQQDTRLLPNTPTHNHVTVEIVSSPAQTIIEKKVESKSLATGLILGMRKPFALIVVFMLIGLAVTTFFGWFDIPGLDGQIAKLGREVYNFKEEVDQLTEQVDRLKFKNDRYWSLNDELKGVKSDLEKVTFELNNRIGRRTYAIEHHKQKA